MTALMPGTPVLIDTAPSPGSLLWRRGDRGVVVRRDQGGGWIVRVDGLALRFDADELIAAGAT